MISRLLIANRAEIACRIMRTARELGISTVAIYSQEDERAVHVRDADEAYALCGQTAAETYLNQQAIIDVALRAGADALHPGYGFLAENAEFANRCRDSGLLLVGPSTEAIATMASKVQAKKVMSEAGVPVLPQAIVTDSVPQLTFGPPYVVKASAGGGGRGMRAVLKPSELETALASARREAQSTFGDPTLFIEPLLQTPRHIEVQIAGDLQGNVIHLFERECSIQRRHQKIIEEAPAANLDEDLRQRILKAAVTAGRAIDYSSLGTIEFLVDDKDFFFLEVNTRIQVEHPVTEMITGLDLIQLQLDVAVGNPLPISQETVTVSGHAIEARVYAEDPQRDFVPSTGTLVTYRQPELVGLRCDTGVETGSIVSHLYDSLLMKMIAHGPDRQTATSLLIRGLDELRIHGVVTNRDCLLQILRQDDFAAAEVTTGFISDHPHVLHPPPMPGDTLDAHVIAAVIARAESNWARLGTLKGIPSGWRNIPSALQRVRFRSEDTEIDVRYDLRRAPHISGSINDRKFPRSRAWRDGSVVEVEIDGKLCHCEVVVHGDTYFIDSPGFHSRLVEVQELLEYGAAASGRDVVAPVPGTVVSINVKSGDTISAGEAILTLEAMKMEHQITASADAAVKEVLVGIGDSVQAHQILVLLEHSI